MGPGGGIGGWEGDEDGEAAAPKTPAELRREWEEAAETVRLLERRGGPRVPSAVLDGARAHRDEAERTWRAAKPLHPIGKRLRWAAEAVEAAMAKRSAHAEELEEFEEQTARRRAELLDRRDADEARVARKQQELDRLRAEAGPYTEQSAIGAKVRAQIRRVRPTMWATRAALEGIQADVGPALERALESLSDDMPIWSDLQGVLASVTEVHGVLAQAVSNTDETHMFDIADADSAYGEGGVGDSLDGISPPEDEAVQRDHGTGCDVRHDGRKGADTKRQAMEGPGGGASRWVKHRACGEGRWRRLDDSGMCDVPPAARGASGQGTSGGNWSDPSPTGNTAGTQALSDVTTKVEEAARQLAAKEAAKREQLAASHSPEQRAQAENLLAQQAAAAATQFGSVEALEVARRVHLERVQQVVQLAREKDIEYDLGEFQSGSPEELEDWVRRHI